ncbi:GATOR2 complex protein WDR24-like [Watersipora subatra]|uniref:GATOR2 complex protein WDR24-like n=1 Tax=Watersipora subatra TaxID=2589382 RepID=UPI00355C862F
MSRFGLDKVTPPSPGTFSIDTKGEITCLAANKDVSLVACAGRQVFKVYAIEEDKFTEKHNLRSTQKSGLNYVAVDIVWSPLHDNIIASASSNGSVVFWDINRPSKNKQEHLSHLHERSASRLSFHSQENLLLSGGKDGMCKLFDTRRRNVVCSFQSVSVHDVQWWPNQYFSFASATENGSIQIWDYRNPSSCQLEFPAHSGPVFALHFHPEEKLLASGGRDKFIKIWSLAAPPLTNQSSSVQQTHCIQSIAPVSRVKWRPKQPTQVASLVNSVDLQVHVWELNRPSIPLATFPDHKDVVTSIIWKDSYTFISGGKDSRLIMHSFNDAVKLCEKVNPISLSLNVTDQLALAINERLQLSSQNLTASKATAQTPVSQSSSTSAKVKNILKPTVTKPDKREAFIKDKVSNVFFFEPMEQDFNDKWFKYCAKNYILHGKSFEEMCQHNAEVAERLHQIQIMKHWLLLKILLCNNMETPSFLSHSINLPESSLLARPEANSSVADLQVNPHHPENGDMASGLSGGEESDDHLINYAMSQMTNQDFFTEDNELDRFEMDLDDKDEEYEDEKEFHLPAESFMPSHDLTESADPQNPNAYHSHQPPLFTESSYHLEKRSEQRSPEKISVAAAAFEVPLWNAVDSVISLLHTYAEAGDVQTAVSMYIVLGSKIKSHIDEEVLEGWMTAYVELLEMFRLWCESNTIITKCNVKNITHMNQASTTVYTFCTRCVKPLPAAECGWYCKKCKQITSPCSICHTPVKGTYVWCQGCAHGGHISHMKEWFQSNKQCPTGCGHECEWT